jgi:hypothetical protein
VKSLALQPLLLFGLLFGLAAQPPAGTVPKDVETLIRETADDLTRKDTSAFLDHFDPKMAGFATLHYEIEGLMARGEVISVIEIITDAATAKGDYPQRELKLDWVLSVDTDPRRREIVKVRIEKQGKKWKIVALDPVEFFKPAALP